MLRIAIQKAGRLQEGSIKLLQESGLAISNGKDQLKTQARNFPVEVLFLRDDDIPQYIEDGVADVGIVGENIFVEKQRQARLVRRLDFAKCRLSIAVPRNENYQNSSFLDGIGHALYGELTFDNGVAEQKNFNSYKMIRMNDTPEIEVQFVKNEISPMGLGEPCLPPVLAAVANGVFAATGQRLRKLPISLATFM